MPPFIALLLWFFFLLGLLLFDPAKISRPSLALWVPVIWMFIIGSRLPSQWLGGNLGSASQALEEGNALDRSIFALLICVALIILVSRSFQWGNFIARNPALIAFLLFALMSILWSDFPFVAFKRWFRGLGDYLVILLVLSDADPMEAIRSVLRRLCYVLVSLSVLLVKFYPQYGKQYGFWSGASSWIGATTSKNMLGVACLVSGMFFFWDMATRWSNRRERKTRRILVVDALFIGMTLWLLHLADSATSRVCLVLGCLVIGAARTRMVKRHPGFLKTLIPVSICGYMLLQFGFGINGELAGMVGRNSNLTGRTDLWKLVLNMHTNPVLGTGYESFWLGSRLQWIWSNFGVVNEAHNGYLEAYLNLGLIGLFLLVILLVASYRSICRNLVCHADRASFNLAVWTVLLFYNVTEAAFRSSQLMWLAFLLGGGLTVGGRSETRARDLAPAENSPGPEQFRSLPLQPTGSPR